MAGHSERGGWLRCWLLVGTLNNFLCISSVSFSDCMIFILCMRFQPMAMCLAHTRPKSFVCKLLRDARRQAVFVLSNIYCVYKKETRAYCNSKERVSVAETCNGHIFCTLLRRGLI